MREKNLRVDELSPPWTVKKVVRWTAGWFEDKEVTGTPRLDADLLLAHVLGASRMELYTQMDEELSDEQLGRFKQCIKRRAAGEPVAYLIGYREFRNLRLRTDDRALIPRPDTETLIDVVLDILPDAGELDDPWRVAEVGTGSGAIALALADERPDLRLAATEISEEALSLARENVGHHNAGDRIELFAGDLLEPIPETWRPLNLVVANPPYVAEDRLEDLSESVQEFEPTEALMAGPDGLDVIRRLIPAARGALEPGGWLVFEFGYDQGDQVAELLEDAGFTSVEIHTDLGDRDRVASARVPD
jgi:release factor glutamine methyltransferase